MSDGHIRQADSLRCPLCGLPFPSTYLAHYAFHHDPEMDRRIAYSKDLLELTRASLRNRRRTRSRDATRGSQEEPG